MTTPATEPQAAREKSEDSLKRRSLFAAAWGALAAVFLNESVRPVEAANGGNVVLGTGNDETAETVITNSSPDSTGLAATCNGGMGGTGIEGDGSQFGVFGFAGGAGQVRAGVLGQVPGTTAASGVWGIDTTSSSFSNGVQGFSVVGTGVLGVSTSGVAVFGNIMPTSSAQTIAMYGLNYSTYAGPGPGAGGFGVYGLSAKGHGLVGAAATAGAAAVVGATNGVVNAYAGAFYGPVVVGGNFTVVGGAKSAAVPHPDGTLRRLYCMESPECWFEDFGEGQLACGETTVALDPDFAALVDSKGYHVFLTSHSERHILAVTERTLSGFRVRANSDAADTSFSWRVVAKRKDIAGPRLETVTVPPEPILPEIPAHHTTLPLPIPGHQRRG